MDLVDAVDGLVGTAVEGCLVGTAIMELVEVIFGDWLDKDDGWWEWVVCIIIAGSSEDVELFSLI